MGYLTTITLHNDALDTFKKHPEEFAKAVFKGIDEAQRDHESVDVPFHGYANYITVEPSRHADDVAIYLHWGNTVQNINPYEPEFERLIKQNPDLAKKMIKVAKDYLKLFEKKMKELISKND